MKLSIILGQFWASNFDKAAVMPVINNSAAKLSQVWAALGTRILNLAPGPAAELLLGSSAAVQHSEAELHLLVKFGARGKEPPADANEKRELFHLLGSPLSRLAMISPSSGLEVMATLKGIQDRIAASTNMEGQIGCVKLIVEALKTAHGLVGLAEKRMDEAMGEAEARAEALRRAYGQR